MRGWLVPVIFALMLHLVVVLVLWQGWDSDVEFKPIITPQHIQAKVVELKAKPPKAKKPLTKKSKPKKTEPKKKVVKKKIIKKPKVKPKKPEPKVKKIIPPTPVKKQPVKPKIDKEKLRREAEALAEQERLRVIAEADAKLQREEKLKQDQQLVQSYSQQIRVDIESKWSRPPSARNGMEVTLRLKLVPSGEVIGVEILKRSGNDAFDMSAVNAVRKVQVFEVPKDYELFDQYFRSFQLPFRAEGLSR